MKPKGGGKLPESESESPLNGVQSQPKVIIPYQKFLCSLIPNWLMRRHEVSQGAKLCYGRLAQFAGKDGRCFPGQAKLAFELGVGVRTVRQYTRELATHRLIAMKRHGLGKSNSYQFLDHPWMRERPSDSLAGVLAEPRLTSLRHQRIPADHDGPIASAPDRKSSVTQDQNLPSAPTIVKESGEGESEKEVPNTAPLTPQRGDVEEVVEFWNSFPKLVKVEQLTDNRLRQLRLRLTDAYFVRHWREAIQRAASSRFCTGQGDRGWRATFDWFLKPETLTKLMEGQYDNLVAAPPVNVVAISARLRDIERELKPLEENYEDFLKQRSLREERESLSKRLKAFANAGDAGSKASLHDTNPP